MHNSLLHLILAVPDQTCSSLEQTDDYTEIVVAAQIIAVVKKNNNTA